MWKSTRPMVIRLRDQQLQVSAMQEAAGTCQKGKKNVRIGDRVKFNSIPFHSKRMAFHLGYHSSPALLNYKVLHT